MSTVVDYGEWVTAPEMEFYSFTCRFAAGFKLSQSMSLKTFISSTYSNIKHKTPDFFFPEGKRRKDITFSAEEEVNGKVDECHRKD